MNSSSRFIFDLCRAHFILFVVSFGLPHLMCSGGCSSGHSREGAPSSSNEMPSVTDSSVCNNPKAISEFLYALFDLGRWRKQFPSGASGVVNSLGIDSVNFLKLSIFEYARSEYFECNGIGQWIIVYLHTGSGLEFSLIPGGNFLMGSPEDEVGRGPSEGPVRKVNIQPFLICRSEVTVLAWNTFIKFNPCYWDNSDFPVSNVTWLEVQAWCQKAGLRLPTEAEWEYACRAGTNTRFSFGDKEEDLYSHSWFLKNSNRRVWPVKGKLPNAFGLYDMHGNVREWCNDLWCPYSKGTPTDKKFKGDKASAKNKDDIRVIRGGGYDYPSNGCRCAFRTASHSWTGSPHIGFRPAFSLSFPP